MKQPTKLSKKELAALEEAALIQRKKDARKIRSFTPEVWKKIETWGRDTGNLTQHLQTYCFTIAGRVRRNTDMEPLEVSNGIRILEMVAEKAPELIEIKESEQKQNQLEKLEASIDTIAQVVQWDKKNKILKPTSFSFMMELATGKKPLTDQNKKIASWNLETAQKCGFKYKAPVAAESKSAVQ